MHEFLIVFTQYSVHLLSELHEMAAGAKVLLLRKKKTTGKQFQSMRKILWLRQAGGQAINKQDKTLNIKIYIAKRLGYACNPVR